MLRLGKHAPSKVGNIRTGWEDGGWLVTRPNRNARLIAPNPRVVVCWTRSMVLDEGASGCRGDMPRCNARSLLEYSGCVRDDTIAGVRKKAENRTIATRLRGSRQVVR